MSTHWTIGCTTHKSHGPDVRRSAGGVGLVDTRGVADSGEERQTWMAQWLIEHEWCDLHLFHEPPPRGAGWPEVEL